MLVKPVMLLPGRAKLATKPCPSGSMTAAKTGLLPQRSHCGAAVGQDHIGSRLDQLRHISPHAVGVAGGPASVDAKIAAFRPPEFLQPLAQGSNACLSVRIVISQHQYGDASHPLALLRARRERPRRRRTAKQGDELAPSHLLLQSQENLAG